jgi:hypothetical protein
MWYGRQCILRTQPSTSHGGKGQVGDVEVEWGGGAGTDRGQRWRGELYMVIE